MIKMSAVKPMFLDFLLFSSIFLGFVFYGTKCFLWGYHGTIMIYDTKTIACTFRATYYACVRRKDNLNLLKNKTQLS